MAPPTLGVTFDLGQVFVLALEEPLEQAVSVNERDYLGGLGHMVGQATGRRKVGDCMEVVWV